MIRGSSLRSLYESHGPAKFVQFVYQGLGLVDANGRRLYDRAGNARRVELVEGGKLPNGQAVERFEPSEFSLRELAEAVIGGDWAEQLRPDAVRRAMLVEERRPLVEAGTGAIQATAFANINAFTAVVSGLLEVSTMEGWENPVFIADKLAPAEPTKMFDGRKVIGVTRLGDVAEERLPGMPTKRAQIGERWITQPRTVENALSSEVTQEAVFLDLAGEVLQEAKDVGEWLRWRKEIRVIDAFIGVTNTYVYKGTSYNTYQTASTWDNDFSNELLHWDNVQNVLIKFRDMKDPETNLRVLIQPNMMLVNREKLVVARAIVGDLAGDVQYRDAPGSTSNPQQVRAFQSPYKGQFELLESPLVYQRCTDADGLNLSASNAGKYWWTWERGKPLKYAQNWPFRVQTAAPNQLDMIDRGVVLFTKADERGVPMWYEPRRVVRSKN